MSNLKILQVLNNNVLLVADGHDKQQIVWGKGIGFRLKRGESYFPTEDDHIFRAVPPRDVQWVDTFKELANEIPQSYFELTDSIIDLAQSRLNVSFDGHLLVPLTDHIYFAVQRAKSGMVVSNPMLFDVQRLFQKEFQVGQEAVDMIQSHSQVAFSDDEAGFIAMHLIEHELVETNGPVQTVAEAMAILSGVNEILGEDYGAKFSESSLAVSRMATHLYYLLLRTQEGKYNDSSESSDTILLRQLKKQYPYAGKSLGKIVAFIADKVGYRFNDSNQLFLLIHIIHIIE
nr:PRD domain-containing protein [Lacticaseibacillus casei]